MHQEFERFEALLRHNNVSVTAARSHIFATLLNSDRPLKNGEIATLTPEVNRASVYRVLELFDSLGITATITRGWTHFVELAEPFKPHHHHLQCTHCHRLIALDSAALEELVGQLANEHDFMLSAHHVELSGLCPDCKG